jgi:hypothetical protein
MREVNDSIDLPDDLYRISTVLLDLFLSERFDMRVEMQTITGFAPDDYETLQQALKLPDFCMTRRHYKMMAAVTNNLSGYPHGRQAELEDIYGLDAKELNRLYEGYMAVQDRIFGQSR